MFAHRFLANQRREVAYFDAIPNPADRRREIALAILLRAFFPVTLPTFLLARLLLAWAVHRNGGWSYGK